MAEKKRYTFSFTEDTAEKFEELVKFYSIQKSGVVTLLIREAYEKTLIERIQSKKIAKTRVFSRIRVFANYSSDKVIIANE